MRRLLAAVGIAAAGFGFAAFSVGKANADPTCTFLGQSYNITYDCNQYQPWMPFGTANNPPLGGSAITPGGDGPIINGHEPGWSGPSCPACSS